MQSVQQQMFIDLKDNALFDMAQEYGMDYLNKALDRHVYPTSEAIQQLQLFEEAMPEQMGEAKKIVTMLHQYGAPATLSQIGGRYFGFVCGSAVPAGMAAKNLATFWDQNTAMYVLSPLAAKLESIVEGWLRTLLNLPENVVAGYVSGTSSANLAALAAARYRLFKNQGWDITTQGFQGAPPIKIIAGREAHSTVIKAINMLGFGTNQVTYIDADDQGRIIPALIPALDASTLLILQAGNVNSGSFDDFAAICEKAREAGAWIHVDGAFGLWAGASQKLAYLNKGVEFAHSWAVDGHKTLNTPYDCGIVLCADKEALSGALHMTGGYLVISDDRDGMFYTPEMSRRARVIELWATLKFLGRNGLDAMITEMHHRAVQFAKEVSQVKGFSVLNEVVFNQVLVACELDQITEKVIQNVQEQRICWVGGSTWKKKKVIRVSVCSWATTESDITLSVQSFEKAIKEIQG